MEDFKVPGASSPHHAHPAQGDGGEAQYRAQQRMEKRKQRPTQAEIMEHAYKTQRSEKHFTFRENIHFHTVNDHILPSLCHHADESGEGSCEVCRFEKRLGLPSLPEMIFSENKFEILIPSTSSIPLIQFNTFDALKCVDPENLPNVQVDASEAWQKGCKNLPRITQSFDWTYTSDYQGTVGEGIRVEETDERIDLEILKRRDPISFIETVPLYEDELADNGCAEMTLRVRVMPSNYFVLCRFYLRVDRVLLRVCDCRLYADDTQNYVLREWTKREALYKDIPTEHHQYITDAAQIWQYLPVIETKCSKIYYPE